MNFRGVFAAIVVAVSLGGPALAETPRWVGIWSAEPEWCVNAAYVGSRTPAPVQLTPDEFLGYENTCQLKAVRQVGGLDAWQFTLECQSEGSTYDDAFTGLLEGADALWLLWGRDPVKFTRCPD